MNAPMLTTEQWAEANGCSVRSVKRWLAADQIPGAVLVDGRRMIPADAARQVPLDPTGGAMVTTGDRHQRGTVTPPTLAAALDQCPAFLDLDTAAQLLGVSRAMILRNRDRFRLERSAHTYVMPGAVVREIAGLR